MINNLSKNHTVLIFDNRGIGNTSAGHKNFTINQFAQDTIGLMNALQINKTDIMGFSMGSYIAQDIALTNPIKNKTNLYFMHQFVVDLKTLLLLKFYKDYS